MKYLRFSLCLVLLPGAYSLDDHQSRRLRRGKARKLTKVKRKKKGIFGVKRRPKNIIMLIPDGCDEGVVGLARWYKGENLYVDDMYRASVLPYMANSFITDSAPAGTAYSTGQLTTDKFIAVGPRYDDLISSVRQEELWESYAPIPTILEAAKALGMSTGLVSTSRVTHATPASFAAHVDSRSKEQEIAKQMVFNNIDVVMGGGRKNMLPDSSCGLSGDNGDRYDCLNLEDELTARGYDLCFDKGGLEALSGDKAWCSFASSHMSPDIDRKWISPGQPSLPDMTKKAIELLSKNKDKGFFLMVEGSQVDWAGHSNDPIWMVTEFIAWDNAVKLAKDFANQNGKTAVLALPDHSTGGIKVGNYKHNYLDLTPEFARQPLLNMKMTSLGVVKMMENESKEALKKSVSNNWGINLTDEDLTKIWEYCDLYKMEYQSNPGFKFGNLPLNHALSRIVSEEYTIAGWTSHGHNGEEVPMWTHGVRDFPKGMIRNIDVGKLVGSMLGGVERLKDQLYVDVSTIGLNYHVELSDIKNQYAIIEEHVFPLNTDYFLHQNGTRIYLPGITVHAPMTNKLYVHSKFIEMIKK